MKIVFTLQNICIPVGVHMFFLFNTNISIPISPNAPNASNDSNASITPNAPNAPTRSLNLPSIALPLSLGLDRLRLSIVYHYYPLHSACTIFLCYTEQLSSFASNSIAIFQWKIASASLSQARLAFCINTKKPTLLGLA